MTQQRADEIVRKVIYARLNVMPELKDIEDAFYVGRMVGQMQRQLEIELSLEVEDEEYKVVDLGNGVFEKRYKADDGDYYFIKKGFNDESDCIKQNNNTESNKRDS